MSEAEILELVGYLLGAFAVGYVFGLATVTLRKALDLI